MIDFDTFSRAIPTVPHDKLTLYYDGLMQVFAEADISNGLRQAAFLAQIVHESMSFQAVKENLNYSAQGLLRVFPYYFKSMEQANAYARQPEKIANLVYGNRLGNGPPSSGEGWRYRGRGLIQVTGKENYMHCGNALGVDLIADPEYLETPEGAPRSAGWYWSSRGLNQYADNSDMETITRRINGGLNGYQERMQLYNQAISVLN